MSRDWLVDHRGVRAAWALWAVVLLAFTIVTIARPGMRSVTPVYREASGAWRSRLDIYPQHGMAMNYLPQFALLFSPFERAPLRVGDALWRILQMAVYVSSIRRLARAVQSGPKDFFFPVSILALPAALGSTMNGQSNMLLAGAMAHATVDLISGRRWAVAAWLMVGLVAKPIAIVMILLLVAADVATIPWMLGGMVLTAAAPFLFAPWPYVAWQYGSWYHYILRIAPAPEHRFDDISGLLRTLGVYLPVQLSLLVRLVAAVFTLGVWWVGSRRLSQPNLAFTLLGLSAGYLMLFNPLTESNSYVILSHAIAVQAVRLLMVERRSIGWLLLSLTVALGNASFGDPIWPLTKLWLKPVVATVFTVWLAYETVSRQPRTDPTCTALG